MTNPSKHRWLEHLLTGLAVAVAVGVAVVGCSSSTGKAPGTPVGTFDQTRYDQATWR